MDNANEALMALKPVTFRYKREIDPAGTPQFGLIAEEVEYDAMNARSSVDYKRHCRRDSGPQGTNRKKK